MKGYPFVYLLLATAVCGCAIHHEYEPKRGYAALETITDTSYFDDSSASIPVDKMTVKIVSIQRIGDENILYPPSDKKKVIYLQPGEYKAKIDCKQPFTGKGVADIVANGTPLGDDQIFIFNLAAMNQGSGYNVRCAKSSNGQIFVSVGEYIEVVGT